MRWVKKTGDSTPQLGDFSFSIATVTRPAGRVHKCVPTTRDDRTGWTTGRLGRRAVFPAFRMDLHMDASWVSWGVRHQRTLSGPDHLRLVPHAAIAMWDCTQWTGRFLCWNNSVLFFFSFSTVKSYSVSSPLARRLLGTHCQRPSTEADSWPSRDTIQWTDVLPPWSFSPLAEEPPLTICAAPREYLAENPTSMLSVVRRRSILRALVCLYLAAVK